MGSDGSYHFIPSSSSSEDVQRTPATGIPQSSTPKPRSEVFLPGQADISLFSGALRDVSLDFTGPRENKLSIAESRCFEMEHSPPFDNSPSGTPNVLKRRRNRASALDMFESPGAMPGSSASIEFHNSSPSLPRYRSNRMFVPPSPEADDSALQTSSPAPFVTREGETIKGTMRTVDDDAGEVVEDSTEMERLRYPLNQGLYSSLNFCPFLLFDRVRSYCCFTLHDWETFFDEIKEEWNQTALLATILLTTNCAFLAIFIFQAPVPTTHGSPEQIASYVSLTTGLFGLVLALAMYRHHKFRTPSSPAEILAIRGKT
ncbi:hypothetical protein AGABI1DRAFT_128259 [Agaricus bisporus var. burnettii JB137-S8]|uniref:Uncharacterized protein n=1 Tax=Agaricus bisporus var. burnettii (strain JB137-S8 / ATCC MYA-4627 / FGSC 10392) TaxID=597362 RepID=K5XVD6_AGABU|nr:uncharacterized protein AGABI1DRAFT_128259 [Agaricus bisporus var. burnettii JB137-S8]EKM79095.1 hypothetical protein AGABI1DRAFT_128259 [Agaricus bisporus var. burnettii JB137-S8]